MVERDLEEVNSCLDHHRGKINCWKTREKEAKEKVEELGGLVIGAAHEAKIFKSCLDWMKDNICKCGCTLSEVGEEFVSSEEEARMELSYASDGRSEHIAPPVENPIPIPVPATCCLGSVTALPPFEEITEEPTGAICENLDALLREVDKGRVRDLQEGSSQSVVHFPPRLGFER